ncbi:MAG: acetoin utilization protein AcuC [Candidatus Acetothermia bacterium]|jgi:acetoin utilization protein AcuC|nr:acetoin utilization protein AcuC [Candidatus Acetothermia bacterium]MDH7504678.1 acetoin utilization protein AcuC [Candidatus Acetothermia bacterium]
MARSCLVKVDRFQSLDFGPGHPLKVYRLGLTFALMEAYGLTKMEGIYLVEPREATEEEALSFHNSGYLEVLQLCDSGLWTPNLFEHGLGTGDNPVFSGVYRWATLAAGSSLVAAEEVLAGRARPAFNIAGGLHHAMPARASGFCHINDVVLAINKLLQGFSRIAYVDIDAHHGDGVQFAFYDTDRVLTISTHESGYYLFPGTGFVEEIGEGQGKGYAVNIPFLPGARDDAFIRALEEVVLPLLEAYKPEALVTQLGADGLRGDPLTSLSFTTNGFLRAIELFKGLGVPWLALGGGGYNIGNVTRAWTLAWAKMNGVEIPDEVPASWRELASRYDVRLDRLRDEPDRHSTPTDVLEDLDRTIRKLRETVFPIHGLK